MLCISSPGIIYLLVPSLYPQTTPPHFPYTPSTQPSVTINLLSVSTSSAFLDSTYKKYTIHLFPYLTYLT